MFKDKIIAALKLKFPGINLSKKRLDSIAAKIETKVIDDETKIDAELALYNEYNPLTEIAKQDDALRNAESKLKKPAEPAKVDEPAQVDDIPDDAPPYVKQLLEGMKTMQSTIATMQGENVATTIRGKIADQLKDVPEKFWQKWKLPDNDEGIESFVTDAKTDFESLQQDRTNQGLGQLAAAGNGAGNKKTATDSKEISPAIKNLMDQKQEQWKSQGTTPKDIIITSKN